MFALLFIYTLGSVAMLFVFLGWSCIPGLIVLSLFSPLSGYMIRKATRITKELAKTRDERVKWIGEILKVSSSQSSS